MCKADLGEWHKVNAETCIATKYTVVDLEPNEHYRFRVSAVNGAGKGESCEVAASVQTIDRLSSPELDIDANFKQTHIVRAGANIRLFIAFKGRPVPTATWSKADSDLGLRADIQVTDSFSTLTVENCNRTDAGKYVFTVENNSGSKSIAFTVKVLDTPGPPGPITFKDVTRGSITLMWDAPILDGGARIHHYIVEKREASRLGEPCELTEPVVATEEPAPPKRLDIVDTTKSSVVLAWLKPDHDGGSRITGYLLEMKQKGSDYWVEAGQTKQLTFTVEGLTENNEYEFRIRARNNAGYSQPREAFSSVIIKEPQIEPTADLSGITRQLITCKTGSSFTIDIPISGRPVPKVTWKLEEMRLKETDRVTIKTTKDRTTLTVKDSMRGDSGKYYLTLENTAGVKTFTVTVVVIGRPGPVTRPIDISSVTITNYIVEKRESGTTAWQLVNSSVKRTQIKVTHLTKYMEYTFRVSSENRFGVSKPIESVPIVAEHPFGKESLSQDMNAIPPSPPTRPEVYFVSANAMSIRWEEPYHDGGSKVVGYWIEKKERNTILWVKENKSPCFECDYKVTGLVEGLEYQFRIYALNAAGLSKASEASRAVLAQNPVGKCNC
uniref:Titin n=1 Tax=Varanus komodoensis TaxID=61221 RepID=A0A8D2JDF7_VARKO